MENINNQDNPEEKRENEESPEQKKIKKEEQEKREQEERLSLLGSIVEKADDLMAQKAKDKIKENEKLKFQLLSGKIISIDEIKRLIAKLKQPYVPHFRYEKDYYKEIFRLNKWNDSDHKKFRKPPEVARWTCSLIYGRFSKEVFSELKRLNPFIGYLVRRDKFFQYLNKEGQDLLDIYIDECIEMMKAYDDWDKFERAYCAKYKLPYQEKLF